MSVEDCHGSVSAQRVSTHVGIDRWTGGAAENLLFSVEEPVTAAWEPIRLSLDVDRLRRREFSASDGGAAGQRDPGDGPVDARADGERSAQHALALLLFVVRDLADGWLALGSGVTRGRGAITVREVRVRSTAAGEWDDLDGRTLADLIEDPPPIVERAMAGWREVAGA